ncbi:MAG: tryptophan-rich sensory protein [Dehalococcoidia bacterium]|nr:MAG: tryptophan-rich sensory protein [Dehalococcoidia bacterium]
MKKLAKDDIKKLAVSIAICHGAGGIGAYFTAPNIAIWYAALEKPALTPPNAVFMPVWLTLYTLMGVAVFLIWRRGLSTDWAKVAFKLFWVQLALNAVWSVAFFGFQSIIAGFVIILALITVLLITIIHFFRISKAAGGLLIPYICWLGIASYLNGSILMLNP